MPIDLTTSTIYGAGDVIYETYNPQAELDARLGIIETTPEQIAAANQQYLDAVAYKEAHPTSFAENLKVTYPNAAKIVENLPFLATFGIGTIVAGAVVGLLLYLFLIKRVNPT